MPLGRQLRAEWVPRNPLASYLAQSETLRVVWHYHVGGEGTIEGRKPWEGIGS